MNVTFQQMFFPNIVMFVVKSHEWNFSYGIQMVQSTHIQYMTMYFNKCCNYLNNYYNMFPLWNILVQVLNFHNFIIQSFNINKNVTFLKITLFGS